MFAHFAAFIFFCFNWVIFYKSWHPKKLLAAKGILLDNREKSIAIAMDIISDHEKIHSKYLDQDHTQIHVHLHDQLHTIAMP